MLHVYGKTANTGNTIGPENKGMIVMIKMAHTAATEIEEELSERKEIGVPYQQSYDFLSERPPHTVCISLDLTNCTFFPNNKPIIWT